LDERLISRFSGGLVVDIGAPDYETRVAILRRKAEERRAKFQPGVLETVAAAEFQNVRELMGALNRLVAYQAVNDVPLNAEGAKQLLGLSATARAGGPAATAAPSGDEFGAFLHDVTVTVGKAVEAWRARVAEAGAGRGPPAARASGAGPPGGGRRGAFQRSGGERGACGDRAARQALQPARAHREERAR